MSGPSDLLSLSRADAVLRAVTHRWQGAYDLGSGNGNRPGAPTPLSSTGRVDCSNAVHWFLGSVLDRSGWKSGPGAGLYLNTDGILLDSHGIRRGWNLPSLAHPARLVFEPVPRGERPQPGDLVVAPGVFNEAGKRVRAGHVQFIIQVSPGFDEVRWAAEDDYFTLEGYKHLQVVDAALRGNIPPAIRENNAWALRDRGCLVRYKGWRP